MKRNQNQKNPDSNPPPHQFEMELKKIHDRIQKTEEALNERIEHDRFRIGSRVERLEALLDSSCKKTVECTSEMKEDLLKRIEDLQKKVSDHDSVIEGLEGRIREMGGESLVERSKKLVVDLYASLTPQTRLKIIIGLITAIVSGAAYLSGLVDKLISMLPAL